MVDIGVQCDILLDEPEAGMELDEEEEEEEEEEEDMDDEDFEPGADEEDEDITLSGSVQGVQRVYGVLYCYIFCTDT